MGNPSHRQIVKNSKERDIYIKKWGRTHPIYISVYPFTRIYDDLHKMHQYAKVNYVVNDFDNDGDDPYKEMIRMHEWLCDQDTIHRIHLSGRGFHIFFWIYNNLKYKKIALANVWDFLHGPKDNKDYENPFKPEKYYRSPKFGICPSTRGDIGQIIRLPNTKNFKSDCYCIVIDEFLLQQYHSLEEFQRFAHTPYIPRSNIYFGTKTMDISEFDCTKEQYDNLPSHSLTLTYISYKDMEINKDVEMDFDDFPYCIKHMINNVDLHFRERNEIIKFLVNQTNTLLPYTASDVMGVLWKIRDKNRWLNWFFRHNRLDIIYRNVRVVYDNCYEILPSCYRISKLGFCDRGQCKWKNIMER